MDLEVGLYAITPNTHWDVGHKDVPVTKILRNKLDMVAGFPHE